MHKCYHFDNQNECNSALNLCSRQTAHYRFYVNAKICVTYKFTSNFTCFQQLGYFKILKVSIYKLLWHCGNVFSTTTLHTLHGHWGLSIFLSSLRCSCLWCSGLCMLLSSSHVESKKWTCQTLTSCPHCFHSVKTRIRAVDRYDIADAHIL